MTTGLERINIFINLIYDIMKCHGETFLLGLLLGALTGMYAERYSRTTMKGRKMRREINRTVREMYGTAEQQIGRLKERAEDRIGKLRDKGEDIMEAVEDTAEKIEKTVKK